MSELQLNVLVVGAGIAGLTAAVGMRKAGHKVTVFERASNVSAFGAAVVIGPNAAKVLDSFGFDTEAANAVIGTSLEMFKGDTLACFNSIDLEESRNYAGRQYYCLRIDVARQLTSMATRPGKTTPAKMIYNAKVVSYGKDKGILTLEDGSTYQGDLIIAADGVHSVARAHLLGAKAPPVHTGTTIVRFMIPTDRISADPETANLVHKLGQFTFYVGPDRKRYLLQYPADRGRIQNFGMYSIQSSDEEVEIQEHKFECDQASLRQELQGFHPTVLGLVSKTSEILPLWKIPEHRPLDTWHGGRLVVIGDSAHAMLPNQGQGAAQAIEDGGALSVLFSSLSSSANMASVIEERLRLFEQLRKPRASAMQIISNLPYFEDSVSLKREELLQLLPQDKLPADTPGIRLWNGLYNVLEDSRKVLESSCMDSIAAH